MRKIVIETVYIYAEIIKVDLCNILYKLQNCTMTETE